MTDNRHAFSKTNAFKWRVLTIMGILFVLAIVLLMFIFLLKGSEYLANIISPQNGELYTFIIIILIIIGAFSFIRYGEYKNYKKYLPVVSNDISIDQRRYIYDKLNSLENYLISKQVGSFKSYYKEDSKRFKWMKDTKLMVREEQNQNRMEDRRTQIAMVKEKLEFGNMNDTDIELLNQLLKNTWKLI